MSSDHDDPTRVRSQAQLTTASGTVWVVMGAVTTALVGVMFTLLALRLDSAAALVALAGALGLLLALIGVRVLVRPGQARLTTLAALYLTLVAGSLVLVLLVTAGL